MTRGPDKQFDPEVALEKAMMLFWANGYAATGMSEIQVELGIGRKSIYDTFGCKRDLYIKALQKYARAASAGNVKALNGDGPALQQIRALMRDYAEMHKEPGSIGCMLGACVAEFGNDDAEIASIAQQHLGIMEDGFFGAFERAKQAGEIVSETNSRDLARLYLALVQGVALMGKSTNDPAVPKSIIEAALAQL